MHYSKAPAYSLGTTVLPTEFENFTLQDGTCNQCNIREAIFRDCALKVELAISASGRNI
jgi:hypothetical protein